MLEKLHEKRSGTEGGFTLIELLIVIVILGILAAIVIFSVSGVTDTGGYAACQATTKTLNSAAEAFYAQSLSTATPGGATTLGGLVTGGFIHADGHITAATGTTAAYSGYTETFNPVGTATNAGTVSATFSGKNC